MRMAPAASWRQQFLTAGLGFLYAIVLSFVPLCLRLDIAILPPPRHRRLIAWRQRWLAPAGLNFRVCTVSRA